MANDYNKNIGFVQIDARYTLATGFKNKKTGEIIPFDGVDFKIITFITQREAYFKNVKHSPYFESLDRICTAVTGSSYRSSGSNRARIKKLMQIGLLDVATTSKGSIKNAGKKSIRKLDNVLRDYDVINPALSTFDTPEATEQRNEAKAERLEEQKIRQEKHHPHFEDMTPCDGTENYAALIQNSEDFDLTPAPDNYNDSSEANQGFIEDINIDGCPTWIVDAQELASFEQYIIVDEDTAEREEENVNLFTDSCDEKPEPIKHLAPVEAAEATTKIVETSIVNAELKGDKSQLVSLIGNVDVSDIDVESKGVGWFAAPLARGELNRVDTKRWLTVLHTHFWDDYSPDQTTVEAIRKKLICEVCGDNLDDLGYCLNRDCPEHESVIPF
ncbi:TPA: hypothetical protein NJ393_000255 [Vibrio parahaemolyticus]|nr:hypothetical protein [Vibrio parahaemolyticus]EJG0939653.1 hypothetical protein [Vibrio parahaemolyticus O1]MBE4026696.1 hypothetical protein [Vibrio parahaemolyticus]HCG7374407.1 hypothetical protein [Vibrio parahaemolyticus]HCH1741974.1 hypothetical protein [Vibrio parahaemolyticus]